MCPTLLEALDMERNEQGILEFKDYLLVVPSRPVGKLYDVKVEAMLAAADQIKRLTAIGAIRPPTALQLLPPKQPPEEHPPLLLLLVVVQSLQLLLLRLLILLLRLLLLPPTSPLMVMKSSIQIPAKYY